MYGKEQQLVQLLVQEPPSSPKDLEATMVSSRSVSLKWQHKSGNSDEVFKFIVEYRDTDGSWRQVDPIDAPMSPNALIDNLSPATKYAFRVFAVGSAGKSPPSSELEIRTEPQRPAGAPMNLAVRPLSSTELIVTWAPPSAELRHGEIQGFNVGYRTPNMGAYNFTTVMGDGEDGGELLLGGLEKYTRYLIVVQAFNEVGTGPMSDSVTAQTMEDGMFVIIT